MLPVSTTAGGLWVVGLGAVVGKGAWGVGAVFSRWHYQTQLLARVKTADWVFPKKTQVAGSHFDTLSHSASLLPQGAGAAFLCSPSLHRNAPPGNNRRWRPGKPSGLQ